MATQKQKEKALERAAKAQTRYWDALGDLEAALGFDLDDIGELSGYSVEDLKSEFGDDEEEAGDACDDTPEPAVCIAGNPTVAGQPCGDPDCVCYPAPDGPAGWEAYDRAKIEHLHAAEVADGVRPRVEYVREGERGSMINSWCVAWEGKLYPFGDGDESRETCERNAADWKPEKYGWIGKDQPGRKVG